MKITPINNLSFQKKLIATCSLKSSNGSSPCSFYQLEDTDRDYFSKLVQANDWRDYHYVTIVDGDIRRNNVDKIYVLEDKKSDCLGFMKVDTQFEDNNSLEFIEVRPDCRTNKNQRQKSYIGETMLNFLAQLTKLQEKSFVSVPFPNSGAVGFYKKCYFTPTGHKRACILSGNNIDKLRTSNFAHTGSVINFVG